MGCRTIGFVFERLRRRRARLRSPTALRHGGARRVHHRHRYPGGHRRCTRMADPRNTRPAGATRSSGTTEPHRSAVGTHRKCRVRTRHRAGYRDADQQSGRADPAVRLQRALPGRPAGGGRGIFPGRHRDRGLHSRYAKRDDPVWHVGRSGAKGSTSTADRPAVSRRSRSSWSGIPTPPPRPDAPRSPDGNSRARRIRVRGIPAAIRLRRLR